MPALPCVIARDPEVMADALAQALEAHGACLIDGLPGPGLTTALRAELGRLQADAALSAASVGRGDLHRRRADIRGDATLWLDDPRCGPAAMQFLAAMDALRIALNRLLFLGLDDIQAHYAVYPVGATYARHRDRFLDDVDPHFSPADTRVLSLVTYLNDDWRIADGGALRLQLSAGAVDIAPCGGRSVCFLSEMEHEVLPATRERLSIASWLRTRANHP